MFVSLVARWWRCIGCVLFIISLASHLVFIVSLSHVSSFLSISSSPHRGGCRGSVLWDAVSWEHRGWYGVWRTEESFVSKHGLSGCVCVCAFISLLLAHLGRLFCSDQAFSQFIYHSFYSMPLSSLFFSFEFLLSVNFFLTSRKLTQVSLVSLFCFSTERDRRQACQSAQYMHTRTCTQLPS